MRGDAGPRGDANPTPASWPSQPHEDAAARRLLESLRVKCRGPLLFLEEKLAKVRLGERAEEALEERSRRFEAEEEFDYRNRVDELEATGFRTSRNRTR